MAGGRRGALLLWVCKRRRPKDGRRGKKRVLSSLSLSSLDQSTQDPSLAPAAALARLWIFLDWGVAAMMRGERGEHAIAAGRRRRRWLPLGVGGGIKVPRALEEAVRAAPIASTGADEGNESLPRGGAPAGRRMGVGRTPRAREKGFYSSRFRHCRGPPHLLCFCVRVSFSFFCSACV